jgi:hypothetical protein
MSKESVRIFEYMLRTSWLHFEDALEIGKIKLFAGSYQRGNKEATETAVHYVDVHTIRPLLHDLSWSKPVEFTDFKGTADGDGVVSRVLRVNSDKEKDKVWFSLSSGPGKETATGAVTPAGKATKRINVGLTLHDARQMAYAVLEYMTAWRTAQLLQPPRRHVDIDELNESLFGNPTVDPEPFHAVGQTMAQQNGHRNGQVSGEPTVKELQFHDGMACPERLKSHFLAYLEVHGNNPPYSEEKLIQWIYR